MKKAILFDLDGTLLPMDTGVFTQVYFQHLAKALCPNGIEADALIAAVVGGTKAMVKNDGSRSNKQVFWERFEQMTGRDYTPFMMDSDRFYTTDFNHARSATGENPHARELIELARRGGRKVVLATNPFFPMAGQRTRLSWIGLQAEDFDLVTSYENDSYCKPNPLYYRSVLDRIGLEPEDCLMIGNDEDEDMYASSSLGMDAYLVTDCRVPGKKKPWTGPQGSLADLKDMLEKL